MGLVLNQFPGPAKLQVGFKSSSTVKYGTKLTDVIRTEIFHREYGRLKEIQSQ